MRTSRSRNIGRGAPDERQAFLRGWCALTGAAALAVSLIDAVLLQQRVSFFTGGFLSDSHLRSAGEFVLFGALSVLADAAVIGLVAATVLWAAPRIGLNRPAAWLAALLASVGPLIVADLISYRLLQYFGDALDLTLAYELAGGSVGELWAVASSHLALPVVSIVALGGAGSGTVWLVNRYARGSQVPRARAALFLLPVAVTLLGLSATAVAATGSQTLESGLRRKPSAKVLFLVAGELTDFDRDGFGLTGNLVDPDPFNAAVFPYAIDIPGNGIDENGIGGDLPDGSFADVASTPNQWTSRRDVLLFVLESFRADLVGAELNGRAVTPVLNDLARRGISSKRAYSPNGYTAQSRFHLFTGSLVARTDSLIDDFKANGYTVAYFSGQDESFGGLRYDIGFARADVAFDARSAKSQRYSTSSTAGSLAIPLTVVQDRIQQFLADHGSPSSPLFIYVNFHDTHFPYAHDGLEALVTQERLPRHRITPEAREALWATYANTAANVDRAIGQVISDVRQARGADPAVVITADHGESLFDDEFLGHGHALDEVQTRVPLIAVNLPLQIAEPASHVDLRDAIRKAMSNEGSVGHVSEQSGRAVFQYLGTLDRPRQIAFLRDSTRTIYDFRTRHTQFRGGEPKPVDKLRENEQREVRQLIWHWERLLLRQARMRGAS